MSVPQPWPRRRPVVPLVIGIVGLFNLAVAVLAIAQHGSSPVRWGTAALWVAVVVLGVVSWRRQVRRFDEETARLERSEGVGAPPDAEPPSP